MSSGGYPGKYENGHIIKGLDDAGKTNNAYVFHAGTSTMNENIITKGGRVLGVTSRGETIQEAINIAYSAVNEIYWKDVHFRNDIAKKAIKR